ncbi:MAG: thioredoxin-disulfide reductase [Oscillospiraceae bacterium]
MIDVIIIGAGTAGLTAAIYACRAGFSTIVIEKSMPGGQIVNTPEIENYPAIPKISGFDFVQTLISQAQNLGAKIVYEQVQEFNFNGVIKTVTTNKSLYEAYSIIIANGCEHRQLECSGEKEFFGKGISYCATCDGAFFAGKTVCVVGGGNTALQDAIYLAKICEQVYIIHRRDEFRAERYLVEQIGKIKNIHPVYNAVIEEVLGDNKVNAVTLCDIKTKACKNLQLEGVFVAIGMKPDNKMFAQVLDTDSSGYFLAGEDCKTRLDGVYVAGDTRTKKVRQLITAAADGAVSAINATEFIIKHSL